jgi:formylglycine-generating enzyme required for sulfatase activity
MVYVPAGKFLMGRVDGREHEKPQHEVVIAAPFWFDLTPVTNAMYAEFIREGGYTIDEYWTKMGLKWLRRTRTNGPSDDSGFTNPQQPRVGVTWFEADAYCRWRGGRLPTEAEWEWAARGPENRIYPWGNKFEPDYVIYTGNSAGKSATVAKNIRTAGASWVGALDMSGNVWEWLSTLYRPYPYRADDGRENIVDDKADRVMRGGSWWFNNTEGLRADYRFGIGPNHWSDDYGFRVARS